MWDSRAGRENRREPIGEGAILNVLSHKGHRLPAFLRVRIVEMTARGTRRQQ